MSEVVIAVIVVLGMTCGAYLGIFFTSEILDKHIPDPRSDADIKQDLAGIDAIAARGVEDIDVYANRRDLIITGYLRGSNAIDRRRIEQIARKGGAD